MCVCVRTPFLFIYFDVCVAEKSHKTCEADGFWQKRQGREYTVYNCGTAEVNYTAKCTLTASTLILKKGSKHFLRHSET